LDAPPMIYSGNPTLAEPGMVRFPREPTRNLAMDHTILMTECGSEALSRLAPEYSVCM